jgi:anion-transporting  ArsA/GET3 family ATPase
MEIIFVTGKGGVGKSAVAAGFALSKAREGKKTVLVELGDQSFYKDYFNLPEITYKPRPLSLFDRTFDIAQWDGHEALKEYALHLFKIESLYRLFFENSVSKALINVAPGLPELSILGKITSGPPRNAGPPLPFNCIVVDAYASGHFMALMKAPLGMAQAVRFGPMGEQVRAIEAVLRDPKICQYHVVAIPEELPVTEGIELAQNIEKTLGHKPQIILNKILTLKSDELGKPSTGLEDFALHLKSVDQRQKEMRARISESGFRERELPWILKSEPEKIIDSLARELTHA